MNKIDQKLIEIRKSKKIGLMTHVVIGYPSLQETIEIVKAMAESGVDFVELQIPFSDPVADGPTIMQANEESLAQGTLVKDAFEIMKELSSQVTIPLLFMAYYNTVFRYGVEKFCKDAKEAGVSGLIVPDMPMDEENQEHFYTNAKRYGLIVIHVISPASTPERLRKNAAVANGFIYCTARQGTTDAKKEIDPAIHAYLQKVRKYFSIPVAVGFGISTKERVSLLKNEAEVAIIGSALIDVINKTEKKERVEAVKEFIKDLSIE